MSYREINYGPQKVNLMQFWNTERRREGFIAPQLYECGVHVGVRVLTLTLSVWMMGFITSNLFSLSDESSSSTRFPETLWAITHTAPGSAVALRLCFLMILSQFCGHGSSQRDIMVVFYVRVPMCILYSICTVVSIASFSCHDGKISSYINKSDKFTIIPRGTFSSPIFSWFTISSPPRGWNARQKHRLICAHLAVSYFAMCWPRTLSLGAPSYRGVWETSYEW